MLQYLAGSAAVVGSLNAVSEEAAQQITQPGRRKQASDIWALGPYLS